MFLAEDIRFSESQYLFSVYTVLEQLIKFPFGVAYNDVNIFSNEVYLLRMALYYGILLIIFWVIGLFIIFINLKYQDKSGLFFSISLLALFISSGHYPTLVNYPFAILVPLAFVFMKQRPKDSMTKSTIVNNLHNTGRVPAYEK